jgi:Domain of unknown function (DUF3644)
MAARPKWWHMLHGSRREALLAVDLYNRAAAERSLEGFVVHMHMAWLYLHHARFLRDGVDYRYRHDNGRFVRVDGEIKTWELARCLREAFPTDSDPVRANVEFFIKVRNKIDTATSSYSQRRSPARRRRTFSTTRRRSRHGSAPRRGSATASASRCSCRPSHPTP